MSQDNLMFQVNVEMSSSGEGDSVGVSIGVVPGRVDDQEALTFFATRMMDAVNEYYDVELPDDFEPELEVEYSTKKKFNLFEKEEA